MCYQKNYKSHGHHGHFKHHPKYRYWKKHLENRWNYPPVNIQELEDRFELYMYIAGFTKEDVQIKVSNNHLIVTGNMPEENLGSHWKRQEFNNSRFERKFELSEKVDQENITAKFNEGVLEITLKKLAGYETIEQEINIA